MTNFASLSALAGRVLLAFFFVPAGFAKLGDIAGNMAYTASGGLPGWFVFPALALEIVAGLAILVGWQTRWAALGLAAFTVVGRRALPLHPGPERSSRRRPSCRRCSSRRTSRSPAACSSSPASAPAPGRSTPARAARSPRPERPARRGAIRAGLWTGALSSLGSVQMTRVSRPTSRSPPSGRPGIRSGCNSIRCRRRTA